MDVITVRQVAQYPQKSSAAALDAVLVQSGGIGSPYNFINAPDLVSTALLNGADLNIADGFGLAWPGVAGSVDAASLRFTNNLWLTSTAPFTAPAIEAPVLTSSGSQVVTANQLEHWFDVTGNVLTWNGRSGNVELTLPDILRSGGAPVTNPAFNGVVTAPTIWNPGDCSNAVATTAFVQQAITGAGVSGRVVSSFNGRGGDVVLTAADITFAASQPGQYARANTPPSGDTSNNIATTLFVDDAMTTVMAWASSQFQTYNQIIALNYAPLNSPQFTGIPTAPTASQTVNSGQIATTAFVHAAVTASTTGVSSFNGRTGIVTLAAGDVTGVGGALLASPVFTGTPAAPTAAPGTATTQVATCAFVSAAVVALNVGVTTFNARAGAVVLTAADVTGVGGALLASPAFSGVPTAPTAANTVNNTQVATTAYVQNVIAGLSSAVTSFNGRTGAITLQASDLSAATGALLASPAFTGTPTAPTPAPGTSTTGIATTAFVAAAIAAVGGVTTFNGRAGAVTLTSADITGAGGALLAGPTFTGVPAAPTAAPGTSSTQLATTAFVTAAVAGAAAVSSFNGRTGAVSLQASDVSAVGGALLASPAFTGTPTAPTPVTTDNSTTLATTAYVTAKIAGVGGVTTFNGRAGAVTLTTADITGAGGATAASPTFTGTATLPGWTASLTGAVSTLTWTGTSPNCYIQSGYSGGYIFNFRNSNSGQILAVIGTSLVANVANYLQIHNAATGNPAVIDTAGADANRSIQLVPAGTGTVQVPTMTAGNNSTAAASTAFVAAAVAGGAIPRSHLAGLTISTGGSSSTFSVAPGQAVDNGNVDYMSLSAAISKTTAAWAVGSGNGGLDTGTIANSTWYHVHLIKRTDTQVVDALVSLSPTAPTLPTNYTEFRRIGSMLTNASGQWTAFTQLGDDFTWVTPVLEVNNAATVVAATLRTISVPSGLQVAALMQGFVQTASTASIGVLVSSPDSGGLAAGASAGRYSFYAYSNATVTSGGGSSCTFTVRTNTSGQVYISSNATGGTYYLSTFGWTDRRGRDN